MSCPLLFLHTFLFLSLRWKLIFISSAHRTLLQDLYRFFCYIFMNCSLAFPFVYFKYCDESSEGMVTKSPLDCWRGNMSPTSWRAFLTCCAVNRFFFTMSMTFTHHKTWAPQSKMFTCSTFPVIMHTGFHIWSLAVFELTQIKAETLTQ